MCFAKECENYFPNGGVFYTPFLKFLFYLFFLFHFFFCPFDISVGVGAFVIGLSQISSFFSYSNTLCTKCKPNITMG